MPHGHPAGDVLLVGIAALLHDATRRDLDLVARIGGEEFIADPATHRA